MINEFWLTVEYNSLYLKIDSEQYTVRNGNLGDSFRGFMIIYIERRLYKYKNFNQYILYYMMNFVQNRLKNLILFRTVSFPQQYIFLNYKFNVEPKDRTSWDQLSIDNRLEHSGFIIG